MTVGNQADEALGKVVAREGSKHYALMAAWGSALLDLKERNGHGEVGGSFGKNGEVSSSKMDRST